MRLLKTLLLSITTFTSLSAASLEDTGMGNPAASCLEDVASNSHTDAVTRLTTDSATIARALETIRSLCTGAEHEHLIREALNLAIDANKDISDALNSCPFVKKETATTAGTDDAESAATEEDAEEKGNKDAGSDNDVDATTGAEELAAAGTNDAEPKVVEDTKSNGSTKADDSDSAGDE